MYIPSMALTQSKFTEDVLITEYFPLSKKTQHGVIIPAYNNGAVSVVFQDLMKTYNFIGREAVTSSACDERILTKEEYTADLNGLVEYMTNLHNGEIQFVIKDIDEMYNMYVAVNTTKHVAGIVNICRYRLMNPVTDTVVIPPEGLFTVIGIETYAAALKRNLPSLELDMFTLNNMYQMYLKSIRGDISSALEIPSLITCPNLESLVNLIGQAGDYLDPTTIDAVIDEVDNENILIKYYERIGSGLGVRDRVARSLLCYHPHVISRTIAGAKKHLGVLASNGEHTMDRTVVWYKTKNAKPSNSSVNLI